MSEWTDFEQPVEHFRHRDTEQPMGSAPQSMGQNKTREPLRTPRFSRITDLFQLPSKHLRILSWAVVLTPPWTIDERVQVCTRHVDIAWGIAP